MRNGALKMQDNGDLLVVAATLSAERFVRSVGQMSVTSRIQADEGMQVYMYRLFSLQNYQRPYTSSICVTYTGNGARKL